MFGLPYSACSEPKQQTITFFEGRYKGRVAEIHSKRLLNIERGGHTDIVIHVNKLKEGWDVSNLFTIVPLRASASDILTEQTLGRGLRLPYGKRTGVDAVDTLTVRPVQRLDREGQERGRRHPFAKAGEDWRRRRRLCHQAGDARIAFDHPADAPSGGSGLCGDAR
jgi:superfamily II DNA or RNA helicase